MVPPAPLARLLAPTLIAGCLGWLPGAALAQAPPASPRPATTLGGALAAAGVDTPGLPADDLGALVADVSIEQSDTHVTLAYFDAPVGQARRRLHVRVRDASSGSWRGAVIDAEAAGTITQVRRAGAFTLVETHRDHGDNRLLVLDPDLALAGALDGTALAVLPDGVLVFDEGVRALAPACPVLVSTFWPATREVRRLHPLQPWSSPRRHFVDRVKRAYEGWGATRCAAAGHHCNPEHFEGAILSAVRADARGTRLAWIQRLGPAEGERDGPVDFRAIVLVTCDREVARLGGRCRERAFGSYDGPDGTDTTEALNQALAAAVR